MDKIERYSWEKESKKGRFDMVAIADLIVDESYQRDATERSIISIAKNFNWSSFGTIMVMKREDGKLYVVDGQHRVGAARRRGNIKRVPAMVFESDGSVEEAKAFYDTNTIRHGVSAYYRWRARITAGMFPETEIKEWLDEHDLKISDSSTINVIRYPATIIRMWNLNKEACKSAILCQLAITDGREMNAHVHTGLHFLEKNGIDTIKHVEKIMQMGGVAAISSAINRAVIEGGYVSKGYLPCAIGVLAVMNHGKHRKIRLPEDGRRT